MQIYASGIKPPDQPEENHHTDKHQVTPEVASVVQAIVSWIETNNPATVGLPSYLPDVVSLTNDPEERKKFAEVIQALHKGGFVRKQKHNDACVLLEAFWGLARHIVDHEAPAAGPPECALEEPDESAVIEAIFDAQNECGMPLVHAQVLELAVIDNAAIIEPTHGIELLKARGWLEPCDGSCVRVKIPWEEIKGLVSDECLDDALQTIPSIHIEEYEAIRAIALMFDVLHIDRTENYSTHWRALSGFTREDMLTIQNGLHRMASRGWVENFSGGEVIILHRMWQDLYEHPVISNQADRPADQADVKTILALLPIHYNDSVVRQQSDVLAVRWLINGFSGSVAQLWRTLIELRRTRVIDFFFHGRGDDLQCCYEWLTREQHGDSHGIDDEVMLLALLSEDGTCYTSFEGMRRFSTVTDDELRKGIERLVDRNLLVKSALDDEDNAGRYVVVNALRLAASNSRFVTRELTSTAAWADATKAVYYYLYNEVQRLPTFPVIPYDKLKIPENLTRLDWSRILSSLSAGSVIRFMREGIMCLTVSTTPEPLPVSTTVCPPLPPVFTRGTTMPPEEQKEQPAKEAEAIRTVSGLLRAAERQLELVNHELFALSTKLDPVLLLRPADKRAMQPPPDNCCEMAKDLWQLNAGLEVITDILSELNTAVDL